LHFRTTSSLFGSNTRILPNNLSPLSSENIKNSWTSPQFRCTRFTHLVVIEMTSGEVFLEAVAAKHKIWSPGKVWSILHNNCLLPLTCELYLFKLQSFYFL
jgi:hypothetical protein